MDSFDDQSASEVKAVRERYGRRTADSRYELTNADVLQTIQERQRAILYCLVRKLGWTNLSAKTLLEIGCGTGGNLLEMLRIGFQPGCLIGLELLPDRVASARQVLPASLQVVEGDALSVPIKELSQDIVYQSVVFSSILSDQFQENLAARMWSWVRPGGGVLWYDFIYNNPRNPDVRSVPVERVRKLFPEGQLFVKRVTLAPPISRRVCRIHANCYHILNAIPWLRSHVLCLIQKPK